MKNRLKRIGLFALSVILLAAPVTAWLYRSNIYDWSRLRGYRPSTGVTQLAIDTTMTNEAQHLFLVNHPAIQSSADFNRSCPDNGGEQTIILGCYHQFETGIFLYNVNDNKLAGVVQVTAAHETLHAVYERLSVKEKQYVNDLLEDYYHNQLKDQRLLKTIEAYKKSEPNDIANEMHSIFGTEIMTLPPALETYYKQYFKDRQKVVAYAQNYQSAFTTRQDRVAADDAALKNLKAQIDDLDSSLKNQANDLQAQRQQMNDLLARNQTPEYNALVPVYNQKVTAYNADVATERSLVEQYNVIVKERNALALEENELVKAIDSRPNTINTQ